MKQLADSLAAIDAEELNENIKMLFEYAIKITIINDKEKRVLLNANEIAAKLQKDAENLSPEINDACKGPRLQEFVTLLLEIRNEILKNTDKKDHLLLKISNVYDPPNGMATQVAHLELMSKTAKRLKEAKFQTNGTVFAAFEGKLHFTTLVESRMRGLADEDVDPNLDDINIESSKKLGSGNVNTVYEVTCKDGSKYVFKPEAEGRQAIESLYLSVGLEKTQMIAGLNMASQKTAELLGLDDVMTKTTVGSHKGAFGIFMEKAPGVTADTWGRSDKSGEVPKGQLSPAQIKALSDNEYAKVVGGLMRKSNRLEWFDLITGQGDRHANNYMISVNGKDFSVSLKGIDNDACFPVYRRGIRTFVLDVATSQKFLDKLEVIAKKLYPFPSPNNHHYDRRLAAEIASDIYCDDPGIKQNEDGGITVNTTKANSPLVAVALMETIGIQTVALPDHIDEDFYNHLMALEKPGEMRKKFIADMTAHLSKAAADVAITRLDKAIAHAKKLAKEGKVISETDWLDHNVQRNLTGKIRKQGSGDFEKIPKVNENDPDFYEKGERSVAFQYEFVSNGYFRRDIVRAIAKDGWFDEAPNVNALKA